MNKLQTGLIVSSFIFSPLTFGEIYHYDKLNRLVKVTYSTGDIVSYRYDAGGNLLSIKSTAISATHSVKGYIKIAYSNTPLSKVTVTLGEQSTITDDEGYFEFSDVATGKYSLTAAFDNYFFPPQSIDVNKSIELDVKGISQQTACALYGVHDENRSDSQFFVVSPTEGNASSLLGSIHVREDIEALDIHPQTDEIFAASGDDGKQAGWLYNVNAQTGELTAIGSTGFNEINGLSFTSQGVLWGWAEGDGLIRINTATGAGELIVAYDGNIEDMTWNTTDDALYFVQNNTFYSYSPAQQLIDAVGCTVPNGEIEAIEMLPTNDLLFAIHNDSNMFIYALNLENCEISSTYAETKTQDINLNDVEGIAWPTRVCGGGQ